NSLEPSADEPQHSSAWQTFEPLYYRYVEQLSPEEVADQMAISVRHLRRKQQVAVEVLADLLWGQYHLDGLDIKNQDATKEVQRDELANAAVIHDLAWVKETASSGSASLNQTFLSLMNLAQKLAENYQVRLETAFNENLPQLAVDPVALRQMILDLLQVA